MSSIAQGIVLRGMGIECEEESLRALSALGLKKCVYLNLQSIVDGTWSKELSSFGIELNAQTIVWIPGGFSFSDDFGAGKLMAHWLKKAGFVADVVSGGAHMIGVCNGFQVLCHLGVFGQSVSLQPNDPAGFKNKWVRLDLDLAAADKKKEILMPVRHGEGRLKGLAESKAKAFLKYNDDEFTNGSENLVAGLYVKKEKSFIFGLMPHPEVALRMGDSPLMSGTSRMPKFRSEIYDLNGDGLYLLQKIEETILTGEFL